MVELNGKLNILISIVKIEINIAPTKQYLIVTGTANLAKDSVLVAAITGYQGKTLNARFIYK
jgi:hypothetical protein